MRRGHADFEFFNRRRLVAADRRGSDPEQPFAALVARDDAAFIVEGHADPRSLGVFIDVENLFHLETGQQLKHVARHTAHQTGTTVRFGKDIAPRTNAHFAVSRCVDNFRKVLRQRGFPGRVRNQIRLIFLARIHDQLQSESGDVALVRGFDQKGVASLLQMLRHVRSHGRPPLVAGQDALVVEEHLHPVIACRDDGAGSGSRLKLLSQPAGLRSLIGFRPDPVGCGSAGNVDCFRPGRGGLRGAVL